MEQNYVTVTLRNSPEWQLSEDDYKKTLTVNYKPASFTYSQQLLNATVTRHAA